MIYIFVDESEDESIFVVGGIATFDRNKLLDGIYETRRYIRNKKGLSEKQKSMLLNELKDYVLHSSYEEIKANFIKNIVYETPKKNSKGAELKIRDYLRAICVYYRKQCGEYFNQNRKEEVYIACLEKVIEVLEPFAASQDGIGLVYDIIYDEFGGADFERELRQHLQTRFPNIKIIVPGKSNEVKELQAADVCIGCMRRSLSNEDMDNFSKLKQFSLFAEVKVPYDFKK
ncbi:MAG: DUF3800 domain-containing protein [Firmicutes bacterium]|nr:DUF3800 domain-containing protein [Bacillota bacterium]